MRYAQWASLIYTVTYEAKSGYGLPYEDYEQANSRYTIRFNAVISFDRLTYNFIGWNTQPDGLGISYLPGMQITTVANLTLYAQWQPDSIG